MNKKIIMLILVIFISFCFLSIGVADNVTHDANNTTDHDKITDKDIDADKNNTTDKNKTDDKSKKNYILAKGKGNNIKFSDGFRGFILDYSKSSASSGDEFKRVSTSKASNSNTLKLAVIECYKQDSTDQIGKIMSDFVKTGSSHTKVGKAVAASHEKIGNHEVVKINNHTEAVFDFEVLNSVSGNESDYFAYKVSFKTIDGDEKDSKIINGTDKVNVTNTTNITNNTQPTVNKTNETNVTAMTQPADNETNASFLKDLYDYLAFIANALYDAWKPVLDTLLNYFMMFVNALEELENLFENIMMEIQSLIEGIEKLLDMLESVWNGLAGILKLFGILLLGIKQLINLIGSVLNFIAQLVFAFISLIQQLLNFIGAILNFIAGIISAIISLIQQLLGFVFDLINQIMSLFQAISDFLKSLGSYLVNVFENAVIIIISFVIITIGAFIYNRIR